MRLVAFLEVVDRFCGDPEQVDLPRLQHAVDRLQVVLAMETSRVVEDRLADPQLAGLPHLTVIAGACRTGTGAVGDRLCVGDLLRRGCLAEAGRALQESRLGYTELALIARVAQFAGIGHGEPAPDGSINGAFDEHALVEAAHRQPIGVFRRTCEHMRHRIDKDGFADEAALDSNRLEVSVGEFGHVSLRGRLTAEAGSLLREALEPLAGRLGATDGRRRDERLGDALIELVANGRSGRGDRRPQITVHTSLDNLIGRPGHDAAEAGDRALIDHRALERLGCDATVCRIVFGPGSIIVDAGRGRRLVSGAARRALVARDRGCQWPGCSRDARWTDAHHLHHWTRGGASDMPNLVLLCRRHHWMVHDGRWRMARTATGLVVSPPPGWVEAEPAWSPPTRAA